MNSFERKGVEFLAIIKKMGRKKAMVTKDSLFEVLDHIRLKDGYHLGLKLAEENGMGDESFFYTYKDEDPFKKEITADIEAAVRKRDIFTNLIVEQTEMGAWQAYLLSLSPTVLPLWWHANYSKRTYFFDRNHFKGITPLHREPLQLKIKDIPQPSVIREDEHFVVQCPYWNDWVGLVLVSMNVSFKKNGTVSFDNFKKEVLYEYDCGICF